MTVINQTTLYVNCRSRTGTNFRGDRKPNMDKIPNANQTLYAIPAIIGSSVGMPRRDIIVLGTIRRAKPIPPAPTIV
jgi:hypothetical protein